MSCFNSQLYRSDSFYIYCFPFLISHESHNFLNDDFNIITHEMLLEARLSKPCCPTLRGKRGVGNNKTIYFPDTFARAIVCCEPNCYLKEHWERMISQVPDWSVLLTNFLAIFFNSEWRFKDQNNTSAQATRPRDLRSRNVPPIYTF